MKACASGALLVRYAEYGLAAPNNLGVAALQNAAGNFVRPNEVLKMNITEVFGNDLMLPETIASASWANVSLMSSSELPRCSLPLEALCLFPEQEACAVVTRRAFAMKYK